MPSFQLNIWVYCVQSNSAPPHKLEPMVHRIYMFLCVCVPHIGRWRVTPGAASRWRKFVVCIVRGQQHAWKHSTLAHRELVCLWIFWWWWWLPSASTSALCRLGPFLAGRPLCRKYRKTLALVHNSICQRSCERTTHARRAPPPNARFKS